MIQDSKLYGHLPRNWLLAPLIGKSTAELQDMIDEAAQWGFKPTSQLSRNDKRRDWLRQCHRRAWDMISHEATQDARARRVKAESLCTISAAEVNDWLRSLPPVQPEEGGAA